ncbi:uncharacterized protein LOC117789800 [Drosophila innubila]|uniref:uncharacterized protein LOC117789800 n=1 Tax=Drosophila innubila TaxID=198719 RepID=UPI00148C5B07|nr:uncharacterized protein LOC117789800 [Drosophila innubila]
MSSHWPETPLTSRCGCVRGRKSIRKHPITELLKSKDHQMSSSEEDKTARSRSSSLRMVDVLADKK